MKKAKTIFMLAIIIILVFGVVYSLIKVIMSAFEEKDLLTSEEIVLVTLDSKILTSYSTYYYVQACFNNLIEGCKQQRYNEVYNLYLDDYLEQYTKEEIISKLKGFVVENRVSALKNVYIYNDLYLLQIDVNGELQYILMEVGNGKQTSYQFAFIK